MKVTPILAVLLGLISLSLPACAPMHAEGKEETHQDQHQIVVTSPLVEDVVVTQRYVCQIHSRRHIEVRALEEGYLEQITVKEGQAVTKNEVLFRVVPSVYKAKWDAELAEAQFSQVELNNTKRLHEQKVVSEQEVALYEAKLAKAKAKAAQAEVEFNFTFVKAPFDGIIDRQLQQQGSLVGKGDLLTTLSDNSVMWVYFNVPEARYLELMAGVRRYDHPDPQVRMQAILDELNRTTTIELVLADGGKFTQPGKIGAIEGKFNNETGNIPFRADFPNPDRLLRQGQTGTILLHRTQPHAVVIPQRATYEILDKRYVYVLGADHVARQRLITIDHELEDAFVIKSGLTVNDQIILEGVRQVHDGEKVEETKFRKPEEALANQKNHAE